MTTNQPSGAAEPLGPGAPTPPIDIAGGSAQASVRYPPTVALSAEFLDALDATGALVDLTVEGRTEASRDWWPITMAWAVDGEVPARAAAVVTPADVDQVSAVVQLANTNGVPCTVAAGRSGVCGGSLPIHGGIVLDLSEFSGIVEVDDASLLVRARAGTFGDLFEAELQASHHLTVGHWPQSMSLSTVGGWAACRGAGQYSTRYGKIEDIVAGLEVVLADGRIIHTGGHPRAAVGPDLTQLFLGSEGTLGIITEVLLRAHPKPPVTRQAAWGFQSFEAGLDACRQVLRRGATPAVLRLYDVIESKRNFDLDTNVLLVFDEGDELLVEAGMAVVGQACATADQLDGKIVDQWMGHRNNVDALESLVSGGLVVDTMEIAASWGRLDAIYGAALAAIRGVEGTLQASAHQSHAYTDGACLYFTFAGKTAADVEAKDAYYRAVWDAGTRAVLTNGGALSHHHGIGLHRARYMTEALGPAFAVFQATKSALDPNGILNPGKLGLADPFAVGGSVAE